MIRQKDRISDQGEGAVNSRGLFSGNFINGSGLSSKKRILRVEKIVNLTAVGGFQATETSSYAFIPMRMINETGAQSRFVDHVYPT